MSNDSLCKMMTWLGPDVLWLKFAVVLAAGWLILALALPVLGDVAPPEQAPGSTLGPAGATQVRMVAEQVILDIRASEIARLRGVDVATIAEATSANYFHLFRIEPDAR